MSKDIRHESVTVITTVVSEYAPPAAPPRAFPFKPPRPVGRTFEKTLDMNGRSKFVPLP